MEDIPGFAEFVDFFEKETKDCLQFKVCIALVPSDTQIGDVVDIDEKPVIGFEKKDEPDYEIIWLVKSGEDDRRSQPGLRIHEILNCMNEWKHYCKNYEMVVGEDMEVNGQRYQFHLPIRTLVVKAIPERELFRISIWKTEP